MPEVIPTSVWQSSFRLYGVDVKCCILNNGQRIIEDESMKKLIEAINTPGTICDEAQMQAFIQWQREGLCPTK